MPLRWTGDIATLEDTTAAGVTDATAILVPADYEQSATMEQSGVTLVRVRGEVNLRATVIGGLAFLGLYVVSELSPVNNPVTFAGFIDSQCLWRDSVMVPVDTSRHIAIDVKAQRKLKDDQVVFAISSVAQTITNQYAFRCLIRGG